MNAAKMPENGEPDQVDELLAVVRRAGLNEAQAKAYLALVEYGSLTPAELAEAIGESRTNGYMIADKLALLGLAHKTEDKKLAYTPAHPSAIEQLAERRRKRVLHDEQLVKQGLGGIVDKYYQTRERPGVATYYGRQGIVDAYESILHDGEDLEYLRSPHDSGFVSSEYLRDYRTRRAAKGIVSRPISPDLPRSRHSESVNKKYNITDRAWLHPADYTANVEWDVYGDKVTIITFGEEAVTLTVHSPAIAESVRQMFRVMRMGAKESYARWEQERPLDYHTPVE